MDLLGRSGLHSPVAMGKFSKVNGPMLLSDACQVHPSKFGRPLSLAAAAITTALG